MKELLSIGLVNVYSTNASGRHKLDKINAPPLHFKCTLQSHQSFISASHTLPSMQNPVGSQSTFASEIEHRRPVVRYSTLRGRRDWRKRSGFSNFGNVGSSWFDPEMIFHPSLPLIGKITYRVQSVLGIKLKSRLYSRNLNGWEREGTGDFGRCATLSLSHRFRVA